MRQLATSIIVLFRLGATTPHTLKRPDTLVAALVTFKEQMHQSPRCNLAEDKSLRKRANPFHLYNYIYKVDTLFYFEHETFF